MACQPRDIIILIDSAPLDQNAIGSNPDGCGPGFCGRKQSGRQYAAQAVEFECVIRKRPDIAALWLQERPAKYGGETGGYFRNAEFGSRPRLQAGLLPGLALHQRHAPPTRLDGYKRHSRPPPDGL